MAKPRVFVSSTYYDLKHLRSSLENFIESLGFEPILSEKGDIAYVPDAPLDESCYREAGTADIFVLIIGGRYGSEASSEEKKPKREFFERYDSITKQEYRHALSRNVPTYILIESNVYSEYRTFLKNKTNKSIEYAHVDSVNIFNLIEDILTQPKNNPMFTFDRYSEVEEWLREQWAGIFKELLSQMSGQKQIATLSSKVSELGEINVTLKRYLETMIEKISPAESKEIIEFESKRLDEMQRLSGLKENPWVKHVTGYGRFADYDVPIEVCVSAIQKAKSFEQFVDFIEAECGKSPVSVSFRESLRHNVLAQEHYNNARETLGLEPLKGKLD